MATMATMDEAASVAAADLDTASAKVEAMDIEEKKDEGESAEGLQQAEAAGGAKEDAIPDDASMPDLEKAGGGGGDGDDGDEIEDDFTDDDEDKDTPPADPTVALVEAMAQKEEGNAAFKEGDYTAAVRSYRKGTTLLKPFNKSNAGDDQVKSLLLTLQTNLSMVCFKQDKHKMSRDVAAKALEIDPVSVKALYRRAVAYRKLGDVESARSDLREALKHEPNNKAVRKELVSIKKDVEASRAKEKERLQKAFGANKGGSSFLYNDKEEEERRKVEEKKKQEEAEAEALRKRKIVSRKFMLSRYSIVYLYYMKYDTVIFLFMLL
jgi:tetratricopeptide (TPR) repeat protein